MILIVGLGNPEKDYKGTRHNVGFEAINKLCYDNDLNINKLKFKAHMAEGFIGGKKVICLKPQTYMNRSGESVRDAVEFYKLAPQSIIVVYDDTTVPVGGIRVRERGSAGGHNGMKDIIYQLESDEFIRVRIGIGEKPPEYDLADYVLSKFKKDEEKEIINGINLACDAIECIIKTGGATEAMNRYNSRRKE